MSKRRGTTSEHSSRSRRSQVLEDQPWYHGMIPRAEATSLLVEEGQFLVRTSENLGRGGELDFVISIRHEEQVIHIPIIKDSQGWKLQEDTFPTVKDLIAYYYGRGKPLTRETGAVPKIGVKKFKWLIDDRELKEERVKLGTGVFGKVHRGILQLPTGSECVAIKQISKSKVTDKEKKQLLDEAKLILTLNHINVVRVYGVAADRPPIRIVLELCPGGSLEEYLKNRKGKVKIGTKVRYCVEAAEGMKYLAKKPCIHRDLAARNCLLGTKGELKISDFGMSKHVKQYKEEDPKEKRYPVRWAAPESVQDGLFSEKSDVWSYGVLVWEIFSEGEEPWSHLETNTKVWHKVKSGERLEIPEQTPRSMKKLMQKCWKTEPEDRPTFTEIAKKTKMTRFKYEK